MGSVLLFVLYFLTLSALITAIYGALQREAHHSLYVILVSLAIAFFALGSLLVLGSSVAETAFMGFRIQHIGLPFIGGLWFLYTMDICGYGIKNRTKVLLLMVLPVVICLGVTAGDPLGLLIRSFTYEQGGVLPYVTGHFTLLYYAGTIHIYGFNIASGILTCRKITRLAEQSRKRLIVHLCAGMFPFLIGIIARILAIPCHLETASAALCMSSIVLNTYLLKTGAFRIVAKAKYQLFESVQDGIVIINNSNEYMDANDKAKLIFPVLRKTKSGAPITVIEGLSSIIAQMGGQENKFTVTNDSAQRHYTITRSELLEDNRYIGSTFLIYDVTDTVKLLNDLEKRTAELETAIAALGAAHHTMTAMFESNPHMNVMFDGNFKVMDCNPAAFKFMGFETKEEVRDYFDKRFKKSIPEFQPDGSLSVPIAQRLMTAAADGYTKFESELYINEKTAIVDIEIKRIPYGDSFALVSYVMDLTATREWERELVRRDELLKEAIEEAWAANQAKSAFLANMSHEIRTPMNSIMGFAELATDAAISPQVKEYLAKITDSTKWLLYIINDILDISKIESGKMELENVPFDLHGIFTRCQSVIHPGVTEKGLHLHVYIEPPIGRKLIGDPVRLYQALMNLLSNAVKFTSSGTIRLSSVIKSSNDNSTIIYFEVKDTGIGMTAEQIEKIFEPFVQGDSSTTRNYGGTGLGLAITKSVVKLMGGRLAVKSDPGDGSTFSFELKFETTKAIDDTPEHIGINTIEKPNFNGLILICEDNPMNQRVICEHLARVGLRSMVAENGKIGLEIVQERIQKERPPFDMIFMDIFMPVMDGIEAASKITALGAGTPIVAMTANVMTSELDNYKKCGMYDFVGKPFTTQELWRCLLKHLTPVSVSIENEAELTRDIDELQKKLRVKFVKDNHGKFAEITGAVSAGDMARAHRLAHTLKGNAGQIVETALQNAAAVIEALLKDGAIPNAEQMSGLETELTAVLEKFKPLFDESAARTRQLDDEQTLALFKRLELMLENINPECVNLLGEIRAVPGTEELAKQIEDYDFESAVRTLAELTKI